MKTATDQPHTQRTDVSGICEHYTLKPVGIVPFDGTVHTVVIACSKEAKACGVKNVMRLADAKKICPELVLQCQSPGSS